MPIIYCKTLGNRILDIFFSIESWKFTVLVLPRGFSILVQFQVGVLFADKDEILYWPEVGIHGDIHSAKFIFANPVRG